MKLQSPFLITARLAPGLNINGTFLSFDKGRFVFDFPNGKIHDSYSVEAREHSVESFRFPAGRVAGETNEMRLQKGFAAVLGFLGACVESRRYALSRYGDASKGENSDLFPEWVALWAEENEGEISMLSYDLHEGECLIHEND